ncbi:MAG TPA: hypothetical protein V6D26_12390 [Stenomitos sp.]
MESSATPTSRQFPPDSQIWDSLKQAIATSSGFQRWQMEHRIVDQSQDYNLDNRVQRYLRETLETLAY